MAGKRTRKGKQGKSAAMMMPTADRTLATNNNNNRSSSLTTSGGGTDASSMAAGSAALFAQQQQQQQQQQPMSKDEMELILTSEKRRGVYHCDYCHSDISQLPRIRCAVCPEFDLCLDCFTTTDHAAASRRAQAAVETQNALQESLNRPNPSVMTEPTSSYHHDDTHGYRVCDSTRYPLFPNPRNVVVATTTTSTASTTNKTTTTTTGTITPIIDNTITSPPPENKLAAINEETAATAEDDDDAGEENGAKSAERNSSQDDDAMDIDEKPSSDRPISKDGDVEMSDAKPADASVSIPVDQGGASSTKAQRSTTASISEDGGGVMTASSSSSSDQQQLVHTMDDIKAMWTVEEDLRLLEGIKTHGLGNWVEISEAVSGQGSTGKSPRRCMERYFDDFLGRYGHILPPYTLIMEDANAAADESNDNTSSSDNKASASSTIEPNIDPPPEEGTRTSKRRAALMRNMNSAANQQSLMSRKKFRVIPTESIEGYENVWQDPYLPKIKNIAIGQDVGRDQACKAEQLYVKTIASIQSPDEVERIRKEWAETKLNRPGGPTVLPPRPDDIAAMSGAELAGFMPRRGDFDVEWENDAEQAVADMEFLPDDSEADKQLKLQVLAIYNSRLHERERRKEFVLSRKLWDYRKLHQAQQKLPRDERDLVHRMRLFERFHTPAEHQKFIDDLLKAKRLRKEIAKLQMYRRMGIRTLAEAEKYELDKTRRQYHKMVHPNKESDPKKTVAAGAATAGDSGRHTSLSEASSSSLWKQYQYRTSDRKARKSINRGASEGEMDDTKPPAQDTSPPKISAEQDEKIVAISDNAKDKSTGSSTTEGLLSPQEVSLCEKLNLPHDLYIIIRKTLIFESLQKGLLDKEGTGSSKRALVKLDIEQRDGIIDFFLTAGWVSTKMSHIFPAQP